MTSGSETAQPTARRGAYRRLSVAERRAELITAAIALFAHNPPEDVSLDDVAAAAGASRPLVYRYFPGGKQELYEAALRDSADQLQECFVEPETGPLSERLSRTMDRYLAFVDGHAAGFSALLQGGSVAETSRTNAIVDEVRRTAAGHILRHLGATEPGRPLRTMVRTWITAAEAASLTWLDDGRQPPKEELRDWLVHHFVGSFIATAVNDPQTTELARSALVSEERDGPVGILLRQALPLVYEAEHLL
ncbi:TetR/AcrR family transcriptional regulator [Streptomyces sp. B1866]|uniref:TetR/AcrR family transcriptional regulator n=1 Tax=Streptomyces sp. B1866 TaxID=3075431 RepID=UPI00288F61B1|nr:TetR/AcrR family transcriptional regulator [Streptomyces sp. B1866]MDT3400582.1 TetR/AcrR family transcriptional regulator [Streptomyces sp. B1866]